VFYTNYNSRKGRELAANPVAALVFFWPEFHRQVRVEGAVSKVSVEESEAYFRSRPRDGQLSSLTSAQSEIVDSRSVLDVSFEDLRNKYEGMPVPRPPHWGGYRLAPERMEFWQARFARLNDRVLYELQQNGTWLIRRLAP
jgi:pyridoxamine 5'-phosphate oxidase